MYDFFILKYIVTYLTGDKMNEAERRRLKKKRKRRRKIRLYIRRTIFLIVCVCLIFGIYFAIDHFLVEKKGNREADDLAEDLEESDSISRDELIHSGTIYDGIYLDQVEVSGLKYEEAMKAYEEYLNKMGSLKLIFKDSIGTYSTTLSEADLKVDYESAVCDALTFGRTGNILNRYKEIQMLKSDHITLTPEKTIDEEKLTEMLTDNADEMKRAPVNSARMDWG